MSIDAMKQAREAIEWALDFIPPESETDCECPLCAAYDALRLAIEQAERQEPVAWVWNPAKEAWEQVRAFGHWQQGAIYAFGPTPPAAPVQEPVATLFGTLPVYDAARPQRQPLTEEEITERKEHD